LLLGGGLFAAYTLFAPPTEAPRELIVVDAAVTQGLEQSFKSIWTRPPTDTERRGLIEDFLVEEILYREAQNLGLDKNDIIVRRRMRQKMEFLLQESLSTTAPDEAALRDFFKAEASRYREPGRISFRQIFLGEGVGDGDQEQWAALLRRLNDDDATDLGRIGQGAQLPARISSATAQSIDGAFGIGFFDTLHQKPVGRWDGPIGSSQGWHLVFVESIQAAREPDFEKVRVAVARDYADQRNREAAAALVGRLKQGYEIVIDEDVQ
jgi:hypothetical protein